MRLHQHEFHALGGPCGLSFHAEDDAAARVSAAVEAEVRRVERKYSRYRDDSVVAAINASAGQADGVLVDAETAALLDVAATLHEQSDGRFDATSGVLREVWDFRSGRLPEPAAVTALLPRIGWSLLRRRRLADGGEQLWLPRPGMALDFGGFGKEYAADRAAAVLRAEGIRHGLVELGGDISVVGPHPDGSPWRIGIRHPRDPARAIAAIDVARGGLATSGDYERCLIVDGRRYGHILDARTGWPVADGPASLSVTAPSCLLAGAVCTLGLLQGARALDWLADCPQPWLAVDAGLGLHGALARAEVA